MVKRRDSRSAFSEEALSGKETRNCCSMVRGMSVSHGRQKSPRFFRGTHSVMGTERNLSLGTLIRVVLVVSL